MRETLLALGQGSSHGAEARQRVEEQRACAAAAAAADPAVHEDVCMWCLEGEGDLVTCESSGGQCQARFHVECLKSGIRMRRNAGRRCGVCQAWLDRPPPKERVRA